jgi:hypothetical protein
MQANKGAVQLYERKGFVAKKNPHDSGFQAFLKSFFVFCCMARRYWNVILFMEKSLAD